jgi:putative peptidoglycan lipid II flippase
VSRITGLGRELLVAALFGASAMTDAFNVAFRIPNLFRRLFAEGAFSQAFVPVLAASKAQHGDEATHILINRVATLLAWALLVTCVVGVIASPLLVWAMASGLQKDPRGYDAAVFMTRFMFPYIGFMSLVALSWGAQHLEALCRARGHPGIAQYFHDLRRLVAVALVQSARD